MTTRVLMTARSFANTPGAHHTLLQTNGYAVDLRAKAHPMTAAELREIINGYDGVILGLDQCDSSVIEQAKSLRVISRYGSGVEQVDLVAASKRGIVVTNTPGANRIAVAELSIGLMFALARNLPNVAASSRAGEWKRAAGFELTGNTLGIVGLGIIGREVLTRANALGMTVLGYDPFVRTEIPGVRLLDLETVLGESHIVTLHCAATPDTENLIDAARIGQMRDGAYLINTARGALVDEQALFKALSDGKLAGAAADALRDDPPTNNSLLTLENFIYTPHIGATTRESVERMSLMAAQNLVAVQRGEPCLYVVNARQLQARV